MNANPPPIVELRPYSFRLPGNGETDPLFGCTRTFWAERIRGENPEVQSFMLRRAADKRGIRLIDYASARAWMERQRAGEKTLTPMGAKAREFENHKPEMQRAA